MRAEEIDDAAAGVLGAGGVRAGTHDGGQDLHEQADAGLAVVIQKGVAGGGVFLDVVGDVIDGEGGLEAGGGAAQGAVFGAEAAYHGAGAAQYRFRIRGHAAVVDAGGGEAAVGR